MKEGRSLLSSPPHPRTGKCALNTLFGSSQQCNGCNPGGVRLGSDAASHQQRPTPAGTRPAHQAPRGTARTHSDPCRLTIQQGQAGLPASHVGCQGSEESSPLSRRSELTQQLLGAEDIGACLAAPPSPSVASSRDSQSGRGPVPFQPERGGRVPFARLGFQTFHCPERSPCPHSAATELWAVVPGSPCPARGGE